MAASVPELVEALAAAADPDAARLLARYFKTGPGQNGEGDVFLGVKLSRIRGLTRTYAREEFHAVAWRPLLRSPVHEHRLACLVVMAERAVRGSERERGEIYRIYLASTAYVNNWDLVDVSCAKVVGRWLLDSDRTPLDKLARSPWLWDRRIAMVSTHAFLRAGQSADTYRLAEVLLRDQHDLIHKATGWMLREAGLRVSADELRAFLDRHAAAMPRTTLRYALERLAPTERAHYLALTAGG